jgi:hypothetical protein
MIPTLVALAVVIPSGSDPYELLLDKIDRLETELVSSETQVERLRSMLVDRTLEVKERVKDQDREEAIKLREKKAGIEQQHRDDQYLRDWAVANFDDTRYGRLPPTKVGAHIKRLQKAKLVATRVLLELPEQSRHAIINGRALNTFLELCGKAALNHQQYRKEFERLAELGHKVGGQRVLGRKDIERVQIQKGLRENALVYDAKRGALPLDWPAVLQINPDYSRHLRSLEQAKAVAEADLNQGRQIDALTQMQMFQAADDINRLFAKEYKLFLGDWKEDLHDAAAAAQYHAAEQFVQGLRSDIAQFVAARSIADVRCDELFNSPDALFADGQASDAIAVEDLMAFMAKRGFRFGPAKPNGEAVYNAIYKLMVDYYLDLHSVQVAMEQADRETSQKIAKLDREADQLMRSSIWDPTKDTVAMLTAKPPESAWDYARLLGQAIAEYGRSQEQSSAPPEPPATPKWTEFQEGDRVSNKGFQIWWRGHVKKLVGDRYQIEMIYVAPAFQSRWQVSGIYEFSEGQIKRL